MIEIIAVILILLGIVKVYQKLTKETLLHSLNWCLFRWLGIRLAYSRFDSFDTYRAVGAYKRNYMLLIGVFPNEGYDYDFGNYKVIRLFTVWEK